MVLAGLAAGAVNTAIGSGSLITYPVLLMVGLPPVVANVTNTVGLAPGSVAGTWAFRDELRQHRRLLLLLVPLAATGAVVGGSLLLRLPSEAFSLAVPVLIILAALLVTLQPMLVPKGTGGSAPNGKRGALAVSVLGASVYGGYFSAAQGILLLGILGLFHPGSVQAQNSLKNLLQTIVNIVAAVFFLVTAQVHLLFVLALAAGSIAGAPLGAWAARKAPASVFRTVVGVFGLAVGGWLFVQAWLL